MTESGLTRARPHVAAGALFFDDGGRIMLVKPTYKGGWDLPGGYVEAGETLPTDVSDLLAPRLVRRVTAAVQARSRRRTQYLEHGEAFLLPGS